MQREENYNAEALFYSLCFLICLPFIGVHYVTKLFNATDMFYFFDMNRTDIGPLRVFGFSILSWVCFFWMVV